MKQYLDLVAAVESLHMTDSSPHVFVPSVGNIKDARDLSGAEEDISSFGEVFAIFTMYHRLVAGQAVNLLDAFTENLADGDSRGAVERLALGLQDVANIASEWSTWAQDHEELEPGFPG